MDCLDSCLDSGDRMSVCVDGAPPIVSMKASSEAYLARVSLYSKHEYGWQVS